MKKIVTSLAHMLLVVLVVGPSLAHAQTSTMVLGSTNQGQLVKIDLTTGTVQLIGTAPSPGGWTDLAMDPAGNLYAVSRFRAEPSSVCSGFFGTGGSCAHLYRLDPNTGAVIQHIGDLQAAFVSDIDFTGSGILYGSRFVNLQARGDGGLVTIDPITANITVPPNIRFGSLLENGGLAVHPLTGDLWAIESNFAVDTSGIANIFRVDPSTGLAIPPVVTLGLNGQPTTFGFDALEILPDGRFIATPGGGFSQVYEINPIADPVSGLAEVTLIPLTLDPEIAGNLNGLTSPTRPEVVFLIIDEDTIDNGIQSIEDISFNDPFCGDGDPSVCVNDDIADPGVREILFTWGNDITPFTGLVLPTGEVEDEGLFKFTNPDPQMRQDDGAPFNIEDFIFATATSAAADENNLDKIDGVVALSEADILDLEDKTVCAVVYDSDVSADAEDNYASLKGATSGLTAFKVTAVGQDPDGSVLPPITVELLSSDEVVSTCEGVVPPQGDGGGVVGR